MTARENSIPAVEVATLIEQGDREDQCDGVLGIANPDGSWVAGRGGRHRRGKACPRRLPQRRSRRSPVGSHPNRRCPAPSLRRATLFARSPLTRASTPAEEDLPRITGSRWRPPWWSRHGRPRED